jgi:diguanylate cyclase
MSSPSLRVLCCGLAVTPPASPSTFGALHWQACESPAALAALHTRAPADAWVLGAATAATLTDWSPLLPAALDTAVVLVLPEAELPAALPLLAAGVQDLLPPDGLSGEMLGRAVRLAIERKRIETTLRKAWATDLATGLPNHAQLREHMTHLLALREREPAPMALIVVRVQGLARTEAALGAEAAQVLRRKAAVRLRAGLRASDVVASIGPDAFAVLLAWIDAPEDGERVAAKLAQALAQPFSITGRPQQLEVSAGWASYPAHGKDAEALLQRALAQATSRLSAGGGGGRSADRGPDAAANDEG